MTATSTLKSAAIAVEGFGTAKLTVDGHTFDLAAMAAARSASGEAVPINVRVASDPEVGLRLGQVAWVWAMGRFRRGVVTKISRVNVTVAYVTETNVRESRDSVAALAAGRVFYSFTTTIREKADKLAEVFVEMPPAITEPAPAATQEEAPAAGQVTVVVGREQADRVVQTLLDAGFAAIITGAASNQEITIQAEDPASTLEPIGSWRVRPADLEAERLARECGCRRPATHRGLAKARAEIAAELEDLAPESPRLAAGDVVRIHRGIRLYKVLEVELDSFRDAIDLVGEPADLSMAKVIPCDPHSLQAPHWVSMDLLHRVPPVARVTIEAMDPGAHKVLSANWVAVAGGGWDTSLGQARRPALVRGKYGVRPVLLGTLDYTPGQPSGCLRVGDAIVINDECYQVTWDGQEKEPYLWSAPWRDR